MSDAPTIKALRKLSRQRIDLSKVEEILQEINSGSDQSVCIIWGAVIEDALQTRIYDELSHMGKEDRERLFQYHAPMGDFSSRITMAYAFKIISVEEKSDMDKIRELRNAFAHCIYTISFATKEVAEVCFTLNFANHARALGVVDAKGIFSMTCMMRWGSLMRLGGIGYASDRGHVIYSPYTIEFERPP